MSIFQNQPVNINSVEEGQQFVERELRQLGITQIWRDDILSWTFAPYPHPDGTFSQSYGYQLTLTRDLRTFYITHSNDDHRFFKSGKLIAEHAYFRWIVCV